MESSSRLSTTSRGFLVYFFILLSFLSIVTAQYAYFDATDGDTAQSQQQLKRNNNLNNMFRIGKRKLGNMMRLG
ncbi:unnamed protein product, partial [Mesorhabditis belari]|uniref:Uncharacterized protein n=1 Tax=Mesorhabditis belari TaxID=2138241 RepID=A0AAF3J9B1_9BILA